MASFATPPPQKKQKNSPSTYSEIIPKIDFSSKPEDNTKQGQTRNPFDDFLPGHKTNKTKFNFSLADNYPNLFKVNAVLTRRADEEDLSKDPNGEVLRALNDKTNGTDPTLVVYISAHGGLCQMQEQQFPNVELQTHPLQPNTLKIRGRNSERLIKNLWVANFATPGESSRHEKRREPTLPLE